MAVSLEDLASSVIRKEAQPVDLGVEDVVTPEQQQAAGGIGQPAVLPGSSEPLAPMSDLQGRFMRGDPLTPNEMDAVFAAQASPEATANMLPASVQLLLGKTAKTVAEILPATALPTGGAAIGGALGSLTPAPGLGTVAGAAIGSLVGTELNFMLGLEKESDISRTLALLMPVGGAGVSKTTRALFRATPAGQAIRGRFAAELGAGIGEQTLKAPGKELVDIAFDAVRQSGNKIEIPQLGDALEATLRLDEKFGKKIVNMLEGAGPEAKAAIRRLITPAPAETENARVATMMFGGTPAVTEGAAVERLAQGVDAGDLLEIRKAVKAAKNASYEKQGLGKVQGKRQAQEFEKFSDIIDDTLKKLAASGDPGATQILEANHLQRIQFAQQDVNKLFRGGLKSETVGAESVAKFDLKNIDTQILQAKDAIAKGEPHKFKDLVKTLTDLGDMKRFESTLRKMREVSPQNNPELFGQSFGLLTRALSFASKESGVDALGEILVNKASADMLLKFMNVTRGKISVPILATALAYGRAATGQPLDEVSSKIISTLANQKRLMSQEELTKTVTKPADTKGLLFNPRGRKDKVFVPDDIAPAPGPFTGGR